MNESMQGIVAVAGRVLLSGIFLLSALGNKIPQFSQTAGLMAAEGVPAARLMLAGAIVFLVVGGLSVVVGYRARLGAALLLVFLALATFFFHDFWNFEGQAQQEQMIQFMKNLALMGAFLLLIANGPGPMSLDARRSARTAATVGERGEI